MTKKALYNISLKVILRHDDEFLILTNDENKFDLPGGRIDDDEHRKPLADIVSREISEELGERFRFDLGLPVMHFRRVFDDDNLYVFIVVFSATATSDEIVISEEYNGMLWLKPEEIISDENKFYSQEEYNAFKSFFMKSGAIKDRR